MFVGVGLALVASAITWVIAQTVLTSLAVYGEKLEAIVSLVAVGVLLLILNWFYHRVYWQENLQGLHQRKRRVLGGAGLSLAAAQVFGLVLLGFSSVYREGFETVLFLQAMTLEAGAVTVLEGVVLGLAAVVAVFVLVIALERKLPHKKMLIATGLLITWVLVVMVWHDRPDDAEDRVGRCHADRGPRAAVLDGSLARRLPHLAGHRRPVRRGRVRARELFRRRSTPQAASGSAVDAGSGARGQPAPRGRAGVGQASNRRARRRACRHALATLGVDRRTDDAVDDDLPVLVAVHADRRRVDVAEPVERERAEDPVLDLGREEFLDDRRTRSVGACDRVQEHFRRLGRLGGSLRSWLGNDRTELTKEPLSSGRQRRVRDARHGGEQPVSDRTKLLRDVGAANESGVMIGTCPSSSLRSSMSVFAFPSGSPAR